MGRTNAYSAVFTALFLLGCGGSKSGEPAFKSFSDTPENGTYSLDGRLTSRGVASAGGNVAMAAVKTDDNVHSIATITNQGGDAVAIVIQGGSVRTEISNTPLASGSFLTFVDGDSAIVVSNPNSFGSSYSLFGTGYADVNSTDGSAFAGSFGAETPEASVPSTSATYAGQSAGFFVDASGSAYITSSDVTISTTDFSTVSVASSNTRRAALSSSTSEAAGELDFTSVATVTGNGFSGAFSGTDVSGELDGNFYGPAAEEAAGTFNGTGPAGDYLGAFGAN